MKAAYIGIVLLVFTGITVSGYAGGPSLKELNVSQQEREIGRASCRERV